MAGARRFGSRWCSPVRSIVHTASAYALASDVLINQGHLEARSIELSGDLPAVCDRRLIRPLECSRRGCRAG
jgi:RES domain-containing protein